MKKMFFLVFSIMLLLPVVVNAAFSDLAENHWAAPYINELSSKKVINRYPDGTFKPNDTLTKGAFLKLIMTASLPELDFAKAPKSFEHWAASYAKVAENYAALEEGSITAENIDEPISRIDVIKILSLCDINIRGREQKSVDYLDFSDVENLSVVESILLEHAVASEIIGGYPDGTFKPENNLTRAEASKILSVYMNK